MHPLRKIKESAGSRAAPGKDKRTLLSERSLDTGLIVRDHRGRGEAERPLDLGLPMVKAAVVTVDDQGDALLFDPQQTLDEGDAGPSMPQSDQVGRLDQQDLIGASECHPMGVRLPTQKLGTDVEDDVAVVSTDLADKSLEESRGDANPEIELRDPAEHSSMNAPTAERLDLLLDGV